MKLFRCIVVVGFVLVIPTIASAAGLSPWQFGMTKEQVASFKQSGPYKSFSNGDLETYNGIYRGQKHNVQFYFQNNRLVKIMVSFGEGTSREKAIQTFKQVYRVLEKNYGKVVIPEISVGKGSDPLNADVLAIGAAANASVAGYTHINPVNQPRDMHVWGTIFSKIVGNDRWYYVAIMFEPL